MTHYNFDDTHINWKNLGDFEHLQYSILDIDEDNRIIDALFLVCRTPADCPAQA